MVKDALKWIDAVGTLWKILAGILLAVVFVASCGAGYAKLHYDGVEQNRRITNLEKNDELILNKIVTGLKALDDAQQDSREAEFKATQEYRDEMRKSAQKMELTVRGIEVTVEHIKETMRDSSP